MQHISKSSISSHQRPGSRPVWRAGGAERRFLTVVCASTSTARSYELCQQNDLLRCKSAGKTAFLEVVEGWNPASSSAVVSWKGQLLKLTVAAGDEAGSLHLTALGECPRPLAARCFPRWV